MLVIFHKQSSWWLKLRRAWWEPLNGEGGGWQQSFHILISPHSCSNTIALHKSFSRHAYSIIFFRLSDVDPLLFHSGNIWVDGLIMVTSQCKWWCWKCWLACGLLYPWPLHDEIWTCAKFAICKLLFVSSAFANLFFMWVSGSWASLFSRASENDYGAHHTTPPPPCLAGLRNSLDKNIRKYKCTVCKIHLADTVKNHWAFRKIVEAYTLKTTFKILV